MTFELLTMIVVIPLGMLMVGFVPGYVISLVCFNKLSMLERICISVGLSFTVVAALGLLLTILGSVFNAEAITSHTVWLSLSLVSIIFLIIHVMRRVYS